MIRSFALIAALTALGTGSHAQVVTPLLKGDVTGVETCFLQLMIDNPDNPTLDRVGPIICGERHIPLGQTCDAVGYLLFDTRSVCKVDDLAFWQDQVNTRQVAALSEGRAGASFAYDEGLVQCDALEVGGEDPLDCRIELNWRTTLEFVAADLVAELLGDTQ